MDSVEENTIVLEWVGESSREIFVLVKGLMKK